MPDTYTATLGTIVMSIGGDNNTWGTNLNNSVFQILEDAIANQLTSAVTGGTLDLSTNPPPAGPSAARYAILKFTGTLASNQVVKVPNLSKIWLVNNTALVNAGFTLTFTTPGGSPSNFVPAGGWCWVFCDGNNNVYVSPFASNVALMPNGSAALPAYAFYNETSGWYRNGLNDIRLAIGGSDVLQVTGAGAGTPSVVNILSPAALQIAGQSLGGFTTGDVKLTFKTAADPGWVLMNDSTLGDASSNSTYANAAAGALFILLYNNIADADAPILTSGGAATTRGAQGSAATAFANHCRLTLPLVLGRALAAAGGGIGSLGHALGEQTHTLVVGEIPAHTHGYSGTTGNESATHIHATPIQPSAHQFQTTAGGSENPIVAGGGTNAGTESAVHAHAFSGTTDNGSGGGGAHNNMQPTTFLNVMIKL
jgi:microcystin-dependent protein